MDWIQRMNLVLDYVESNLDGEIDENKISELSASPKGMFQRIFAALTDMSLSEYIRKRKLTQAAFDIQSTNEKIIDISVKYGYGSADSFGLAFKRFHGASPSDARKTNAQLQSFYPIVFKFMLSVKGGNDMQYRILENAEATISKINEFSTDIAKGTNTLAAAMKETAMTMNETSVMMSCNAENTNLSVQLALSIAQKLSDGLSATKEIEQLQMLLTEINAATGELANAGKVFCTAMAGMEKVTHSHATATLDLKELVSELEKSI